MRARAPFGGFREKYTSQLRGFLARPRVARFARPNRRTCLQAKEKFGRAFNEEKAFCVIKLY